MWKKSAKTMRKEAHRHSTVLLHDSRLHACTCIRCSGIMGALLFESTGIWSRTTDRYNKASHCYWCTVLARPIHSEIWPIKNACITLLEKKPEKMPPSQFRLFFTHNHTCVCLDSCIYNLYGQLYKWCVTSPIGPEATFFQSVVKRQH